MSTPRHPFQQQGHQHQDSNSEQNAGDCAPGAEKQCPHLPNEILGYIATHLLAKDLLSFRLANRDCHESAKPAMKKALIRLYLHPSRIPDVLDFCAHEGLRNYVEEVIVLGSSTSDMGPQRDERDKFRNRPWPQFADTREPVDELMPFDEAYHSLISGLNQLKNLKTLRYCGVGTESGWCNVPQETIVSYGAFYLDRTGQRRYEPADKMALTDSELLMGLLTHKSASLRNLSLEQPLPMAIHSHLPYFDCYLGCSPPYVLQSDYNHFFHNLGEQITSCTITVPGTRGYHEGLLSVLYFMDFLQDLTVAVDSDIDTLRGIYAEEQTSRTQFWDLPPSGDCPIPRPSPACKLKRFSVIGRSFNAEPVALDYIAHAIELHGQTLERVALRNILPLGYYAGPRFNEVHHLICKLSLSSYEVALRRIGCAEGCRATAQQECAAEHHPACKRYMTKGPRESANWSTAVEMDRYMQSIGMPLDDDGWWRWSMKENE
jgi:hypothetical protein